MPPLELLNNNMTGSGSGKRPLVWQHGVRRLQGGFALTTCSGFLPADTSTANSSAGEMARLERG
jgi:hypothetical protein